MAPRRLAECRYQLCHNLTRNKSGYCDEHEKMAEEKQREHEKALRKANYSRPNYFHKTTKADSFYASDSWQAKRKWILARDSFMCPICYLEKLRGNIDEVPQAKHVHHIEELLTNWDSRLDNSNLISLCGACHREIHQYYRTGKKKQVQRYLKELVAKLESGKFYY